MATNRSKILAPLAAAALLTPLASAHATSLYCYGSNGVDSYADCHASPTPCSSYSATVNCTEPGFPPAGGSCCMEFVAPDGGLDITEFEATFDVYYDFADSSDVHGAFVEYAGAVEFERHDREIGDLQAQIKRIYEAEAGQDKEILAIWDYLGRFQSEIIGLSGKVSELYGYAGKLDSRIAALESTVSEIAGLKFIAAQLQDGQRIINDRVTDVEQKITQ